MRRKKQDGPSINRCRCNHVREERIIRHLDSTTIHHCPPPRLLCSHPFAHLRLPTHRSASSAFSSAPRASISICPRRSGNEIYVDPASVCFGRARCIGIHTQIRSAAGRVHAEPISEPIDLSSATISSKHPSVLHPRSYAHMRTARRRRSCHPAMSLLCQRPAMSSWVPTDDSLPLCSISRAYLIRVRGVAVRVSVSLVRLRSTHPLSPPAVTRPRRTPIHIHT